MKLKIFSVDYNKMHNENKLYTKNEVREIIKNYKKGMVK